MEGLAANNKFQNHQFASMASPARVAPVPTSLAPTEFGFLNEAYVSWTAIRAISNPVLNRSTNSSGDLIIILFLSSIPLPFVEDGGVEGRTDKRNRSFVVIFVVDDNFFLFLFPLIPFRLYRRWHCCWWWCALFVFIAAAGVGDIFLIARYMVVSWGMDFLSNIKVWFVFCMLLCAMLPRTGGLK